MQLWRCRHHPAKLLPLRLLHKVATQTPKCSSARCWLLQVGRSSEKCRHCYIDIWRPHVIQINFDLVPNTLPQTEAWQLKNHNMKSTCFVWCHGFSAWAVCSRSLRVSFSFIDLYSGGFSSSFHQIKKKNLTQSEHLLQVFNLQRHRHGIWETGTTIQTYPLKRVPTPRHMTLIKVSICQRRLGENFSTAMQILLHNSSW